MFPQKMTIKEKMLRRAADRFAGRSEGSPVVFHKFSGILCILMAAVILLPLTGCGEKGNDWITAPQQDTAQSGVGGEPFDGSFDAPAFLPGRYIMTNDTVNSQTYTDVNGKQVYSYSMLTRYVYTLDISVDEGIVCRYTFSSVYGNSTADGESSVEVDTADPSLKNGNNAVFYDLIGSSFTVTADRNGALTGISGVDGILSEVDGADSLIDEDLLYNMAADIFYEIPDTLGYGTKWNRNQFGIENTYTVNRLSGERLGVSIAGGDAGIPEPVRDDEGYTTTYLSVDNISGTLWLDRSDRAVQELSTVQRSRGTIADDNNSGVYFDLVSTTSTKTEKGN